MIKHQYPTPWIASLHLDGDGWWGPLSLVRDCGDLPSPKQNVLKGNFTVINPFRTKPNLLYPLFTKMHKFMDDPASRSFVYWAPDGRSFIVRSVREFMTGVFARYFNHTSYCKFLIQLSANGFRFRLVDRNLTEFAKEGFVRGLNHSLQKGSEFMDAQTEHRRGLNRCQTHSFKEVHTPIQVGAPLPAPLPGPSLLELKVKEEIDGGGSILGLFNTKTFCMVDDPSTNHIVSWVPSGLSFVVSKLFLFSKDLLHEYFGHRDFFEFLFLLCLNGFKFRPIEDYFQFEFVKEGFVRGQRPLLQVYGRKATQFPRRQGPYSEKVKVEEGTTEDIAAIKQETKEVKAEEGTIEDFAEIKQETAELFVQSLMEGPLREMKSGGAYIQMRKELEEPKERTKEIPIETPLQGGKLVLRYIMAMKQEMSALKEDGALLRSMLNSKRITRKSNKKWRVQPF